MRLRGPLPRQPQVALLASGLIGAAAVGAAALALGQGPGAEASRSVTGASAPLTVRTGTAKQLGPTFSIRGSFGKTLIPGRSGPIGLTLRNPHHYAIRVTKLKVYLRAVRAPRASAARPCSVDDFVLKQFTGQVRIRLAPKTTRTLARLSFPRRSWPQLRMASRPVNQDGCKAARVVLDFRGHAFKTK